MGFVGGRAVVWQEIEKLLRPRRRRPAYLALAYVGTGALDLLHPRQGDVLVVDLSQNALAAGATNPHELERLRAAGVAVHAWPGLHAKTLVVGNTAVVGSANASKAALLDHDEACFLTRDTATVRAIRSFVKQRSISPVTAQVLARAKRSYRPRRGVRQGARGAPFVGAFLPDDRPVYVGAFPYTFDARDKQVSRRGEAQLAPVHVRRGYRLISWVEALPPRSYPVKEGDIVVACSGRSSVQWAYPPGRVVDVERYSARGERRLILYVLGRSRDKAKRWPEFRQRAARLGLLLDPDELEEEWRVIKQPKRRAGLLRIWGY